MEDFFKINHKDKSARSGVIATKHGKIKTPVFMPVGTKATVKGVLPESLDDMGIEILLANTYHLYLRPGVEIIKKHGGLHKFMNWKRPILTDSGGYQVFSLQGHRKNGGSLVKIKEEGVEFRSHIDGSRHFFTPKGVIDLQTEFGSDIMMPLDWCPSALASKDEIDDAVDKTSKWFEIAWNHYQKKDDETKRNSRLFAIIQGGAHRELRKKSYDALSQFDVAGFSIGGVANAGESADMQVEALEATLPLIVESKPRYLMGVGDPVGILNAVERGVDMFDCVTPTRLGRHGIVFTPSGKLNLTQSKMKTSLEPIDESCSCVACCDFTRAYISHLLREKEMLGVILTSMHNISFLKKFMDDMREKIKEGKFSDFKNNFIKKYDS